jgi:hypothetical protein
MRNYCACFKPPSSSLIYLLVQSLLHLIRGIWYSSNFNPLSIACKNTLFFLLLLLLFFGGEIPQLGNFYSENENKHNKNFLQFFEKIK